MKPTGWFSGRTKLITIASIVTVGASAAFAVGANIGILNAADSTNVGELTAVDDLTTPNTQVVDVYLDGTTATATAVTGAVTPGAAAGVPQAFAVDAAGTVTLVASDAGVRLDSVTPAAGWTWTLAQTQPSELMVTFTNGVRTLEFVGTIGADANITGSVTEPIVTPATVSSTPYDDDHEGDDEYEDDEYEDDEYEDDEYEDDEYEGGGDDD
jgi:hypothetical protein